MTTRQVWSDVRKPSTGGNINREDGRVCRVKGYKPLVAVNPTSKTGNLIRRGPLGEAELPGTQAGMRMDYPPVLTMCGEEIPPRIVSLTVYWPATTTDAVTCPKCQGAK